jgi:4-amino-4-deoxy-L-arabinose transferase-like glycosyltransferase
MQSTQATPQQPSKSAGWRHPLIWICALALLVRFAVLPLGVPGEYDTGFYRRIAANLLAGHGYSQDGVTPDVYWMPGAVLLHAAAQAVHPALKATQILWAFLGVGMVAIAYGMAEHWAGRRVAVIFSLMMAVYPYNLIWGNYATTEIPNLMLLMGTAWLLLKRASPIAVGVCFAVACLFRAPDPAYLPLVLAGTAWGPFDIPARLKRAAFAFLAFLVCVTPWSIRTSIRAGTFVPLSAGGLQNVWLGTNPWYSAWVRGEMSHEEFNANIYRDCSMAEPYSRKNQVFGQHIKDFIRQEPGKFLSLLCYKTFRFFAVPPGWSNPGANRIPWLVLAAGCCYLLVLAAAVAGLWLAWRRHCLKMFVPWLLWIGFAYAANIWFDAVVAYRFKTGAETCLLLIAAWLLATLSEKRTALSEQARV